MTGETLAIIAICLTILGFIIGWFGFINRILQRLAKIEVKVDLFWNVVEEKLSTLLHSPDNPVKDALLDKLKNSELNHDEAMELRDILIAEIERKRANPYVALVGYLVVAHLELIISNRR